MKRTIRAKADFKNTLMRNQLTSLVLFESITTTKAKAKAVLPFINSFFNKVRVADLTAKRLAHQTLFDKNAVKKTFEEILPRYKKEETTFVRPLRIMPRKGDAAEMVMISLIRPLEVNAEKVTATKAKTAKVVTKDAK